MISTGQKRVKEKWMEIIKDKGMDCCFKCGYSKCFAAIDFHHMNPLTKNEQVGALL